MFLEVGVDPVGLIDYADTIFAQARDQDDPRCAYTADVVVHCVFWLILRYSNLEPETYIKIYKNIIWFSYSILAMLYFDCTIFMFGWSDLPGAPARAKGVFTTKQLLAVAFHKRHANG